jgi:hypothetical protein
MVKPKINKKLGSAGLVAASLVLAGSIATASAAPGTVDTDRHSNNGYTAQQCKDGGWKNFKNPDGSQKFKNQGECVSFFTAHHQNPGHNFFASIWSFVLGFFAWFGNAFGNLFGSLLRL